MNDLQAHRGPDGEGFLFVSSMRAGYKHEFVSHTSKWQQTEPASVGLGHRRLAIIDLNSRGLQPMASREGLRWVVFNGEIYNFRELRSELSAKGHIFTTKTDTEVLLASYIEWEEDCLEHLEGMYAFAIWDSSKRQLFCARDRLGIKPFYYATTKDYFIFASEIKSLLAFPQLEATADQEAVLGFLIHANCDYGSRTMLKHVKALPLAHSLKLSVDSRGLSIQKYWQPEPQPQNGASDNDRIRLLKGTLLQTIRRHLNSDVPAGSCLSGGLDSSTVVSLIGKVKDEHPEEVSAIGNTLHTFTACWKYPQLDERQYAVPVADSIGASPHLVFPSADDFWSNFQLMAWHQDMPFGSLSYYAQWCVMRAAKEAGVKVLLDGQGGDEVFGGYAKFRYAYLASLFRSGQFARMLYELTATLRQADRYVLDLRNGYRYLPKKIRSLLKVDSLLKRALKADWNTVIASNCTPATRWWRNASVQQASDDPWTMMQRIQLDDISLDTLPGLLRMEDRSSMAFSLEARVPLLDHKLVEVGLTLPDHLKVNRGWSKFAIRESMRGLLPEAVRLRKTKLGFASPDRIWLAGDLREHVTDLIESELRCRDYINIHALRRWYKSEQSTKANADSYLGLFRVLSLEMWMRAFSVS
jgi:asparagine synthase (glutamine-hydrolysing)